MSIEQGAAGNRRYAFQFVSHWLQNIIGFGGRALPAPVAELGRSPLAPLGGKAELSRIELLPLATLGENKEFEPMALRATAQLRIGLRPTEDEGS